MLTSKKRSVSLRITKLRSKKKGGRDADILMEGTGAKRVRVQPEFPPERAGK